MMTGGLQRPKLGGLISPVAREREGPGLETMMLKIPSSPQLGRSRLEIGGVRLSISACC